MATTRTDAFILFNEGEEDVALINDFLGKKGIHTYFWRRDIRYGGKWAEVEQQRLQEAAIVLLFLGNLGWGPTQLQIAQAAQQLGKLIIPVLIDDPPEEELMKADGLVKRYRYVKIKDDSQESLDELVKVIEQVLKQTSDKRGDDARQFDQLISKLADGTEIERRETLESIRSSRFIDRAALSVRLRTEIQEHFSTDKERTSAFTDRPPNLIPAVRSWMLSCLIWTDAENEDNQLLIQEHLQPGIEPHQDIRYWTLAGIYQRNPSYLNTALHLTSEDPAEVVRALSIAIRAPREFISLSAPRLGSDDFDGLWPILRVLRIVPVPELVPAVCALLSRQFSNIFVYYDALFALFHPETARGSVPILSQTMGIEGVVNLLISTLRSSNPAVARDFAFFLSFFDAGQVNAEMEKARDMPERKRAADALWTRLSELRKRRVSNEVNVPGFSPDVINVKKEKLGIGKDVQTLTAVMLAKEVPPPLAIGLFGDWGMGKSFFMASMRQAAIDLATANKNNPQSRFCTEIVSIDFNAWHYVDTNLWASMVSYILEQLALHVAPPKQTPEEKKVAFLAELSSTKAVVDEARVEEKRTQQLITDKRKELQGLQAAREQKEISLLDLQVVDIKKILGDKENKELENALKELGIPAALNTLSDLDTVITESYTVGGRITSLFFSIVNSKSWVTIILLLLFVLVLIPLAIWYIHSHVHNNLLTGITAFATEFTAFLAGFIVLIRKGLTKLKTGLEKVEGAKKRIDEVLAEKKRNPQPQELALQKEIAALTQEEQEVSARLSAATRRMAEIEQRIHLLNEERSLNTFLTERTRSDDYRKHLGLISIIRKDFESLTARLSMASSGENAFRRVDRVILYIDDLDRCPPDKVLEVLQAVHLILSYPLFVVVVGVDPRWLLHSLGKTYSPLQHKGDAPGYDQALWQTTPQNFLEKIFQIPFSLKPMTREGYTRLVDDLLLSHLQKHEPLQQTERSSPIEGTTDLHAATGPKSTDNSFTHGPQETSATEEQEGPPGQTSPSADAGSEEGPGFVISEDALSIKPQETAFAVGLYPFMPNPRAVKRFSNVYRILKAGVQQEDISRYEGTESMPGEFQVPMLLLAILVGASFEAVVLFPALYRYLENNGDLRMGLKDIRNIDPSLDNRSALQEKISTMIDNPGFPFIPGIFTQWLPRVSRFSFDLGKIMYSMDNAQ